MAASYRFHNRNLLRQILTLNRIAAVSCRSIKTSKKKEEVINPQNILQGLNKPIPDFSRPNDSKEWVSYGFNYKNQKADIIEAHLMSFFLISVLLVGTTMFCAYFPDMGDVNWIQREAFLELRRREMAGLPAIDYNFIDPSKIVLPTDEELGDTEIII